MQEQQFDADQDQERVAHVEEVITTVFFFFFPPTKCHDNKLDSDMADKPADTDKPNAYTAD